MEIVKFQNVSFKVDQQFIMQRFSLIVNEFEKVLIYGKSGLGKTTLFRLIMGFAKPSEGQIFYKEQIIDKSTVWDVRKSIAYVPQNLDLTDNKIKDYMKDLFSMRVNSSVSYNEKKVSELLDYFGLPQSIMDKVYKNLSGGEKQRVAIIIGVLLDRELLLLDEITASLSGELKQKTIEYFTKISNKTAIIISHDTEWLCSDAVRKINMEKM